MFKKQGSVEAAHMKTTEGRIRESSKRRSDENTNADPTDYIDEDGEDGLLKKHGRESEEVRTDKMESTF